jgi:hypothetical protein
VAAVGRRGRAGANFIKILFRRLFFYLSKTHYLGRMA